MAVGACFGGPLLSMSYFMHHLSCGGIDLLIGVGLASIIKFISEGTIEFKVLV
jgi:hypothetical protein